MIITKNMDFYSYIVSKYYYDDEDDIIKMHPPRNELYKLLIDLEKTYEKGAFLKKNEIEVMDDNSIITNEHHTVRKRR